MSMNAATRADLIALMARVVVAVFHEEGESNEQSSYTVQRSNRAYPVITHTHYM